uniref:SFRICE_038608 n=1 Tax=Spodoptera frugiperda TaxID=7108 RepID=A0A2H1VHK8_SPOFR
MSFLSSAALSSAGIRSLEDKGSFLEKVAIISTFGRRHGDCRYVIDLLKMHGTLANRFSEKKKTIFLGSKKNSVVGHRYNLKFSNKYEYSTKYTVDNV